MLAQSLTQLIPTRNSSQESNLEFLYENAACGYFVIGSANKIDRINATARLWMGYELSECEQLTHADSLLAPASHYNFYQLVHAMREQPEGAGKDQPISLHVHLLRKDKSTFPALLHVVLGRSNSYETQTSGAKPVRAEAPGFHIAAFHLGQQESLIKTLSRTHEKLRDSNAVVKLQSSQFAAIAVTSPDAILLVNEQERISFANPVAQEILRCSSKEIIGASFEQFIPVQFRQTHHEQLDRLRHSAQQEQPNVKHYNIRGLRANGEEFSLEASVSWDGNASPPFYTAILKDISPRQEAEEKLQKTREQLRLLAAQLHTIREEEQRHIARELHDDIGQRLTALKMDLSTLQTTLTGEQVDQSELVAAMNTLTAETVTAVRRLATGLRPKILDELGLVPALEAFLRDIGHQFDLQYELLVDGSIEITDEVSTSVFRVIQEAVRNITKHAQAQSICIKLQSEEKGLHLSIRDDGQGMTGQDEIKVSSLGLIGIRERVSNMNGQMHLYSEPGKGTTIDCFLPNSLTTASKDATNSLTRQTDYLTEFRSE